LVPGFIVPGREPLRAALEIPTFFPASPDWTCAGTAFLEASVCAEAIPETKSNTINPRILIMANTEVEVARWKRKMKKR
jgi:hypothetical protein